MKIWEGKQQKCKFQVVSLRWLSALSYPEPMVPMLAVVARNLEQP